MGKIEKLIQEQREDMDRFNCRTILYSTFLFAHLSLVSNAYATPEGAIVVGGNGNIVTNGQTTSINQTSQNMAIDWQSYNVQQNERVHYIQPNSSSISLNRIVGNNASAIHGRIDANGQVILVNPNGIFFSPTSVINVGGIMASGLDIKPSDFMNSDYIFNEVAGTDGFVFNSGIINAATGGNVTLLGKQVKNDGMIVAKLGAVNMAAGKQAVVTFDNAGLLGVKITKEILQSELGVDPAVLNNGNINAEGGRILLTASVSQDIFSRAVNTGGLVDASSAVVNADGTFTLGSGSDVVNTGTLDVSSKTSNINAGDIVVIGENVTNSGVIKSDINNGVAGKIELHATDTTMLVGDSLVSAQSKQAGIGGKIKVLGNKVGLIDNAQVNASGANGGGEILIGGDKTGQNKQVRNAEFIYLDENTYVIADAIDNGNGGKLITFATDTARIYGNLTARGGENGGDGGFIETSGLKGFNILNAPDISAFKGQGGEWLIDPYDISIVSGNGDISISSGFFTSSDTESQVGVNLIENALNQGSSPNTVTIVTGNSPATITQSGDITFEANFNYNGDSNNEGGTLRLNASNNIDTAGFNINTNRRLNLEFNANAGSSASGTGSVKINDSQIRTNNGNFTASGVDFTLTETNSGNNLDTGFGGDVTLSMTGSVTINGNISTNNGFVSITGNTFSSTSNIVTSNGSGNDSSGVVTISTNGTASAVSSVSIGGLITVEDNATVSLSANQGAFTSAGSVSLTSNGSISSQNGSVSFSGGNYSATTGSIVNAGAGTINLDGITGTVDLANTITSGNLTALDVGTVNQSSLTDQIGVDGNTIIDSSGTVTLLSSGNNFSRLDVTATNLSVNEQNTLILGNLNLTANNGTTLLVNSNGPIQQVTGTGISSNSNTSINSGANSIVLYNSGNDFIGAVSLNNTGNNNISIRDINSLDLATSNIGNGRLTVDAVGITQTGGAITQAAGASNVTLNAGAGVITLTNVANDFTGNVRLNNNGANDVDITDANNISLRQSSVGQNLTVTSVAGDITQNALDSGLNVSAGLASFNVAGGRSILLGNISNTFSSYALNNTGTSFNNITFWQNNNIDLGTLTITGDLDVNAVGIITNSGTNLTVTGNTILKAENTAGISQKISLTTGSNNFNTVNVTNGNDLTLSDTNAIVLAGLNLDGDLTVNANGNVTQTANIVMQTNTTARINAGVGSIDLSTAPANDFKNIVLNAAGFASVSDNNTINIGDSIGTASNVNGNLTINANGNIDQTAAITMGTGTIADFDAGSGQINLAGFNNDFKIIKLASSNTVSVNDTAGGITLGTTNITGSGTLNVTANGTINDNSEAINVAGQTTLDAGSNGISLNSIAHDVNQVNVTNATSLAIRDSDNLTLGNINLTGSSGTTLNVQTNGLLNQTAAITSNGATVFNTGSGAITLSNNNNDFGGTVSLTNTSGNIVIHDRNAIDFATSNIGTGSLTVNAGRVSGGGITQTGGAINQASGAGTVTLNAGVGAVTLGNTANNFVGEVAITNSGATNNVVLNDVNDIALAQSVISGDLTVTAGTASDITQNTADNGLNVVGTSTFNVDGGRSIILGNTNNQLNGISLNAKPTTGTSLQDVTIANNAALDLQTFNLLGDLNVNITGGGDITNSSGNMIVAGLTTLNTTGNVDLTNGVNDFNQVLIQTANNVGITDTNAIIIGDSIGTASVINGDLTITSNGNINQTAAITMGGATTADFNAGNGQINLGGFNNDFNIIKLASSNAVSVNDTNGGVTLGTTNITGSGTLNVTSTGAINDNSEVINVSGLTTLDAGSNAINLNSVAHDVNQLNVTNATSLAIRDSDNLTLGNVNLTGSTGTTLNVQTNGLLTQTAAITSNGNTVINTGNGGITLNNNNNDFVGTLALNNTSGNITINDQNSIDFATSNIGTGSLTVNAGRVTGGGITQTGGQITQAAGAGNVTLNAATGVVTLDNTVNDFVGEVAISNVGAGNNVILTDTNNIALAQSTIAGDLIVTAGTASDITQNNTDSGLAVTGTATFNVDGGRSISMGNVQNDFNGLVFQAKSSGEQLRDIIVADTNALDLQTLDLTGDLTVIAGGNIDNTTGSMKVAGLTTLTAVGGDIDLTNGINDFNQIVVTSANDVSITESNTLTIGDSVGTASNINGNLTLTTNGDINQTAAIRMLTGTTARLDAGNGDINLASQPTNDFKNVVLTTTGDVNLLDVNNIIIGDVIGTASSIGGDFTLSTNGGITQTAALTMNTGSTAAFSASNGIIDFGSFANDFDIVELVTTNTAMINDISGIRLGDSNVSTLSVNTLGDINDSGNVTVTSLATLDAGSGNDIFINTGTHNFKDIVITGNNVSITDVGGINIGDQTTATPTTSSTINGNFNLTSTGDITDNASVAVNVSNMGSTATLAAGGDVALVNTDFVGGVNVNAGNRISINDTTGLTLGTVTASNEIDLVSGSDINGGTLTSARVNLTAETGINVTTQTETLNVNNTAGDITVNNTGNVIIESLKTVGDITLNNDANISMQPGSVDADYDTGVIAMTTTTGSFLGLGTPDDSNPDITGFSGTFVGRFGSFGTAIRPLVISIKDEILINTRQSISPRYVPTPPRIVNDLSDITFDFIDASNAVSGEQLITLEELEDIDPAIFSDVRNYTYGQIAIRLPRDQLFEDELKEVDKK